MLKTLAGCITRFFKSMSASHASLSEVGGTSRSNFPDDIQEDTMQKFPTVPSAYYGCCDFSQGYPPEWQSMGDKAPPYTSTSAISDGFAKTIECKIDKLSPSLRLLSLKIHDHPELAFHEKFAHDLLTEFMASHGFAVTKHYLGLQTAWKAEFTNGEGGRVLGINAEMDAVAVPRICHGCGHNLIAAGSIGIALAVKEALQIHSVSGKVVLLGTPAEEGGGGKVLLLQRGGYKDMDACIMCHPGPGAARSATVGKMLSRQGMEIEFFGQAAHAGAAPWEGTNALDAAFVAYAGISALRQQIRPDHRVHGIIQGKNWAANVIPDYAKMRWNVRAPTWAEAHALRERVKACFNAGAMATGCKVDVKFDLPYYDVRQNSVMATEFCYTVKERYGVVPSDAATGASTDFGNVSYELPVLHPAYAIPTSPNGGNHTAAFADAARSEAAHSATLTICKGLGLLGFRILNDDVFFTKVKAAFDDSNKM